MYMYIHTCIYTYVFVPNIYWYIYLHMYMYVYVYIYLHIYTQIHIYALKWHVNLGGNTLCCGSFAHDLAIDIKDIETGSFCDMERCLRAWAVLDGRNGCQLCVCGCMCRHMRACVSMCWHRFKCGYTYTFLTRYIYITCCSHTHTHAHAHTHTRTHTHTHTHTRITSRFDKHTRFSRADSGEFVTACLRARVCTCVHTHTFAWVWALLHAFGRVYDCLVLF